MARNDTFFEWADGGSTSVYKFRIKDNPALYVWFDFGKAGGALYRTSSPGPYRVDEPLLAADFPTLDDLLGARGTTRAQWRRDLTAQFGERLGWPA